MKSKDFSKKSVTEMNDDQLNQVSGAGIKDWFGLRNRNKPKTGPVNSSNEWRDLVMNHSQITATVQGDEKTGTVVTQTFTKQPNGTFACMTHDNKSDSEFDTIDTGARYDVDTLADMLSGYTTIKNSQISWQ